MVKFKLAGRIRAEEKIAEGRGIRMLGWLRERYPAGRNWKKKKGFATIEYADGTLVEAELHWYEAQGVGRREMKIKQEVDE